MNNIKNLYNKSFSQESIIIFEHNLSKTIKLMKDHKNIILYGDIQSGKTNNLIWLSYYLLKNNYDWIIILSGDRNSLDDQTFKRFKKVYENVKMNNSVTFLSGRSNVTRLLNCDKAIITLKKQSDKLFDIVNYAKDLKKKIVIFDDECDRWSKEGLNKNGLDNFLNYQNSRYFPISGTPFWTMFSKSAKRFWNGGIAVNVLENPKAYNSLDKFKNYITENKFTFLTKDDIKKSTKINLEIINKILNAIWDWFYKTSPKDRGKLLINISNQTKIHNEVKKIIEIFAEKYFFYNSSKTTKKRIEFYKKIYNDDFKALKEITEIQYFISGYAKNLRKIIETKIKILNSFSSDNLKYDEDYIIIGGVNLSRGNTFENLTHVVIDRNENINSTLMQTARWLGYHKIIPKVYLTPPLRKKFNNLAINNNKIKELCNNYSISNVKKKISINKKQFKDFFYWNENSHDKEEAVLKGAKEIMEKENLLINKDNLVKQIIINGISSLDKIEINNILNKYSLINKDPNAKIEFNETPINKVKFIWPIKDNEKALKECYEKEMEIFSNNIEQGEDVLGLSKHRKGHTTKAKYLKKLHKKCAICLQNDSKLLYASHIKEWHKSTKIEKVDNNNFLILCSKHDDLFEKGYISFDENGLLLCIKKIYLNMSIYPEFFEFNRLKSIKLPNSYFNPPINIEKLLKMIKKYRNIAV